MIPLKQLIVPAGLVAGNQVVTRFLVLKTCDIHNTLLSYGISLPSANCLVLGFLVMFWSLFIILGVLVFVMWFAPVPVIEPFLDPQPAPAA